MFGWHAWGSVIKISPGVMHTHLFSSECAATLWIAESSEHFHAGVHLWFWQMLVQACRQYITSVGTCSQDQEVLVLNYEGTSLVTRGTNIIPNPEQLPKSEHLMSSNGLVVSNCTRVYCDCYSSVICAAITFFSMTAYILCCIKSSLLNFWLYRIALELTMIFALTLTLCTAFCTFQR